MAEDAAETLTKEQIIEARNPEGGKVTISISQADVVEQRRASREGRRLLETQKPIRIEFKEVPPENTILTLSIRSEGIYDWIRVSPPASVRETPTNSVYLKRLTLDEKKEKASQNVPTQALGKYLTNSVLKQLPQDSIA